MQEVNNLKRTASVPTFCMLICFLFFYVRPICHLKPHPHFKSVEEKEFPPGSVTQHTRPFTYGFDGVTGIGQTSRACHRVSNRANLEPFKPQAWNVRAPRVYRSHRTPLLQTESAEHSVWLQRVAVTLVLLTQCPYAYEPWKS